MQAAARGTRGAGRRSPSPAFVTDPCDGRTQGTAGMFDSLPYRNDAAIVLRRLIRSLPTPQRRAGRGHLRQGTARHDDGAGRPARSALRPGARRRHAAADDGEDAGKVQTHRARALPTARSRWRKPRELGCRACASPGGGCQFLGTAATSQVVGEALGLSLPTPPWRPPASRSGSTWPGARRVRCIDLAIKRRHDLRDILTEAASTTPWWCTRPSAAPPTCSCTFRPSPTPPVCAGPPWTTGARVNRAVPRLVDVLPNGPGGHPTVRVFLAGGVPEVMLHLRGLGLLQLDAHRTVHNRSLGDLLDGWEAERTPPAPARTAVRRATASTRTT